jgi:hypothetical protein
MRTLKQPHQEGNSNKNNQSSNKELIVEDISEEVKEPLINKKVNE